MSGKRYTDDFKAEAAKQVLDGRHSVVEVALRLGINKHSLYDWVRRAQLAKPQGDVPVARANSESSEIRRLKAELRRVTEERDILKKAAAYFAKG